MSVDKEPLEKGQILADKYEVGEHLSSGAFARVYVANRISDDMEVAVKALRMDVKTSDPAAVERFIREAAVVTHLQHPNLIRILEFGRTRDDVLFMVMERLQGIGLEEIIYKEPMSPDRVRNILRQMLDALMMAHGQGLIHRDLNPSNVFLCAVDQSDDDHRDWVKILDFGFAKGTPSTGKGMRATLTLDGVRVGIPGYMAPEILESDPELTPLVDLYAVGILGHGRPARTAPVYRGPSPLRDHPQTHQTGSRRAVPVGRNGAAGRGRAQAEQRQVVDVAAGQTTFRPFPQPNATLFRSDC
jgi:serine/threonine-protein kinase